MGHSNLGKYGATYTYILFKYKFTNVQTRKHSFTLNNTVGLEQSLKDFSSIKTSGEYEGDVICFLYIYRYKVLCNLKVN